MRVCSGRLPAFVVMVAGVAGMVELEANAAAPGEMIRFAPHRAVYEITLERAASGSGVVELAGRMVYELNGSRCEGYTQNMRFVTQIVSQDGSEQVNDLRTSSWEDGEGKRLRFNSEQYRDSKLVETTTGDARRETSEGPAILVDVIKPTAQKLKIEAENLFPMQHSNALLTAAQKGERQLVSGLYDGSDKGEKVYMTSAWIGARTNPGTIRDMPGALAQLPSWPVSIAYYEPGSEARDALPAYELSFRIFSNGVSSDMLIDYGEFAVRGSLKELTYYAGSDCAQQRNKDAGAGEAPQDKPGAGKP